MRRFMTRPSLCKLALVVVATPWLAAQTPPPSTQRPPTAPPAGTRQPAVPAKPPTGMVLGRVVDAGTGEPVPGASITLSVPPPASANAQVVNGVMTFTATSGGLVPPGNPGAYGPRRQTTNETGTFVFHSLPGGAFPLSASAPGYVPGSFGQRRVNGGGRSLRLAEGERQTDVTIKLWKFATIAGTVTDDAGEPAVGVTVRLLRLVTTAGVRRTTQGSSVQTDDRGAYRFWSITPGEYQVVVPQSIASLPVATIDAYMTASAAGGNAASEWNRRFSESMAPQPSSGGMRIGNYQIQTGSGRLLAPPVVTQGRTAAYRTVYYPGTETSVNATTLSLTSGQQRTDIDLQLRLVPTVKVSGIVSGVDTVQNLGVRLVPAGLDPFDTNSIDAASTATDPTGQFTFPAVPAGQYSVAVMRIPRPQPPPPPPPPPPPSAGRSASTVLPMPPLTPRPLLDDPTLWAEMPVAVGDADVTGVTLMLRAGARVRGRFVFEGALPQPRPESLMRLTVNLNSVTGRAVSGSIPSQVTADGQFNTLGYPPGRYTVSSGSPGGGWTLKSISVGGRLLDDEVLEIEGSDVSGLTITYTDKTTEISGTVRAGVGDDDLDPTVLIFPANYQPWIERGMLGRRQRSSSAGTDGQFRFGGMPAGDYLMVAVSNDLASDWRDPAMIQKLAAIATRITLTEGEKKAVDLAVSPVRR